jgi:hypothetical protein
MEELNKELENAPKLSNLQGKIEEPKIPEGYFDDLEQNVFARIKAEGELRVAPPLTTKHGGRWRWFAAAAMITGIGLSGWWLYKAQLPTQQMASTADLSTEDAEAYVYENLDSYEPTDLVTDAQDLPNLMHEEVLTPKPQSTQSKQHETASPSDAELDLLDELTDEDLENLL